MDLYVYIYISQIFINHIGMPRIPSGPLSTQHPDRRFGRSFLSQWMQCGYAGKMKSRIFPYGNPSFWNPSWIIYVLAFRQRRSSTFHQKKTVVCVPLNSYTPNLVFLHSLKKHGKTFHPKAAWLSQKALHISSAKQTWLSCFTSSSATSWVTPPGPAGLSTVFVGRLVALPKFNFTSFQLTKKTGIIQSIVHSPLPAVDFNSLPLPTKISCVFFRFQGGITHLTHALQASVVVGTRGSCIGGLELWNPAARYEKQKRNRCWAVYFQK